MRSVVITRPGAPDVLVLEERSVPEPGTEQLLVRVRATALNRADLAQRRGGYPAPPGAPADVPGLEYAGEVVALGPGAREHAVGDRVFGLVGGGGHAEYVAVHERTAVRIPDRLTWEEAAAVPEVFMTAHDALRQAAARPGETVLIHAVASGVGLAAVQLARALGLRTLGTVREGAHAAGKLEAARAHGLDAGLAVPRAALADPAALRAALGDLARAHTGGRGADVALDLVGGAYVNATLHALAERGRHVLIGLVAGASDTVDLARVLRARLTLVGTAMRARPLEERIAVARRFAAEVVPMLADGRVRPTVDATYPLAAVAAAHARLESNDTTGKLVLTVG